ncbi:MFS transporter [Acetobacterium tundrae]|uniref:MFS transporter n=1 Tax=Acetobacterium tundrae TaxID=132932 RepID=A0ABR6WGW7_9FIRM|nr:MFS transporter [Acetobacterium tundrae]MBC3795707.1 MFS transporter [Acetobacterium tundrae]
MTVLNNDPRINRNNSYSLRQIILFLTSQTISLFGSSIVAYAIIWYVTLTTASGFMMTISTLCSFLPQILVSLFAGVWADRYHRKYLIILADALISLATLVLAILFFMGYQELWLLFLVSGIRSFGAGIQSPAVNALIPQLVPENKLMKINGINGSIQSLTFIVAPAISGGLLTVFPLEYTFLIDIVTAMIAVGILFLIPIPIHSKALEKKAASVLSDLKEGLKVIHHDQFIKTLFIYYALIMFFITPAAFLTPLLITRLYGGEIWRLTFNEIFFSGGTMFGGIIITIWGGYNRRIKTVSVGSFAFGLAIAAMGLAPNFILYLLFIFASGLAIPFFSVPTTVLLQEQVEADIQGRIFSILQLIGTTALPLGMLIFGPMADYIPIEFLLIITGILMTLCSFSIIKNKSLATEKNR